MESLLPLARRENQMEGGEAAIERKGLRKRGEAYTRKERGWRGTQF